jgi:hypothetical protein
MVMQRPDAQSQLSMCRCTADKPEAKMTTTPKIDRARRNALRAAGLVGSFLAAGALHRPASAAPGGNGNGNGNGAANGNGGNSSGNGNGNGHGNNGRCFARGSKILTRRGYRPIETLVVGDEVVVHFAGSAPIRALARHTLRSVDGRWDGNRWNRPILIRRGALGENSPAVDLCLTALHELYVDGFLIDAGDLVNGASIDFVAADGLDTLDFFNIELDRHDILDVQGAPVESLYREGAKRCAPHLAFDGGRSRLRSHMRSIMSVVIDRRQPLDIIRDNLDERAAGFSRAA